MGNGNSIVQDLYGPKVVLTRYLYLKDEVQLALLIALLQKSETCLFWAYELYYSGYQEEVFQYLWKIYYDFYATLNPGFKTYFMKKYKLWSSMEIEIDPETGNDLNRDRILAMIINDLLIRPHNMDIFMLRLMTFAGWGATAEAIYDEYAFIDCCKKREYEKIAFYVLTCKEDVMKKMFLDVYNHFNQKNTTSAIPSWNKMNIRLKTTGIALNHQLLAWIMEQYITLDGNHYKGKNLYIMVEPHDITMYETITKNNETLKVHKILPSACLFNIDEFQRLSLFLLARDMIISEDSDALRKLYWYNWEYYACKCPEWKARLDKYHGKLDHKNEKIKFENDDYLEEFYENYGYEPDEQSLTVQEKSIQLIESKINWYQFHKENNTSGLYHPSADQLTSFRKIQYN